MLDMKVIRENPELVKENIRKKFQDEKIALVDQVIVLDRENRETKQKADDLRMMRNKLSKEIGALMKQGAKEEAMVKKAQVQSMAEELAQLEEKEDQLAEEI